MFNLTCRSLGILAFAAASAHAEAPRPDFHPDGSVQIGGEAFPTMQAYFQSQTFRDNGARCGSEAPAQTNLAAVAADCSLTRTTINPAYDDNRTLVIQVVFHVIKKTDGTGAITPALIQSQIDVLNEDYNAIPGTLGKDGTNAKIKFVLARFDPTGAPTTGIEVVTNDAFFADGGSGSGASAMKTALHWDTSKYLNMYTNDAAGLLGYATFPQESAGKVEDGIVLLYSSIGRNAPGAAPYDLGRTATHEIGHYLGLLHTFQGGCGTANAPYTTSDLIADTIQEQAQNFGCTPTVSKCNAQKMNPIENYMDYSDDRCMTKFTVEQSNRARCSLINFRNVNTEPKSDFTFTTTELAATFTSTATDVETTPAKLHYIWKFGDGQMSTEANPSHTYTASGEYDVTLEVVDEGSGSSIKTTKVAVTDPNQGNDAGTGGSGGTGDASGGCCQTPRGGLSFLLCGIPVAFVLLRRRRRS